MSVPALVRPPTALFTTALRLACLLALGGTLTTGAPLHAQSPDSLATPPDTVPAAVVDLDGMVHADLEGSLATGMIAGVLAGGELDFLQGWGHLAEGGDSVRVGDTFTYPALTEVLIAITIRALAEGAVIDPAAPLATLVPDVSEALGRVTLDQLLTHTSGLADGLLDDDRDSQLLALGADAFVADPGEVYSTSRYSYPLAALALERALGLPLTEIVTQAALIPLGMTSSTFDPAGADGARRLTGHTTTAQGPTPVEPPTSLRGLPVLHTTAPDVLQLLAAWMSGGIRGSTPLGTGTDDAERLDPSFRFGDGVFVDVESLAPQAWLTRFDAGFGTTLHLYPELQTALFVVSNGPLPPPSVIWLRQRVAEAVGDIETQLATEGVPVYRSNESTRVPTGLDDLAVWHGVYRNGPIRLALRHVGGQLQYHNGTNDYPLQGMGPATFAYVTPTGAVPMRLTEVAGGRVVLIEGKAYRWESGEVPPVASPTGG